MVQQVADPPSQCQNFNNLALLLRSGFEPWWDRKELRSFIYGTLTSNKESSRTLSAGPSRLASGGRQKTDHAMSKKRLGTF
jgi:hypothetical protein